MPSTPAGGGNAGGAGGAGGGGGRLPPGVPGWASQFPPRKRKEPLRPEARGGVPKLPARQPSSAAAAAQQQDTARRAKGNAPVPDAERLMAEHKQRRLQAAAANEDTTRPSQQQPNLPPARHPPHPYSQPVRPPIHAAPPPPPPPPPPVRVQSSNNGDVTAGSPQVSVSDAVYLRRDASDTEKGRMLAEAILGSVAPELPPLTPGGGFGTAAKALASERTTEENSGAAGPARPLSARSWAAQNAEVVEEEEEEAASTDRSAPDDAASDESTARRGDPAQQTVLAMLDATMPQNANGAGGANGDPSQTMESTPSSDDTARGGTTSSTDSRPAAIIHVVDDNEEEEDVRASTERSRWSAAKELEGGSTLYKQNVIGQIRSTAGNHGSNQYESSSGFSSASAAFSSPSQEYPSATAQMQQQQPVMEGGDDRVPFGSPLSPNVTVRHSRHSSVSAKGSSAAGSFVREQPPQPPPPPPPPGPESPPDEPIQLAEVLVISDKRSSGGSPGSPNNRLGETSGSMKLSAHPGAERFKDARSGSWKEDRKQNFDRDTPGRIFSKPRPNPSPPRLERPESVASTTAASDTGPQSSRRSSATGRAALRIDELSDGLSDDLRSLFTQFDKNGDGHLDVSDFQQLMLHMMASQSAGQYGQAASALPVGGVMPLAAAGPSALAAAATSNVGIAMQTPRVEEEEEEEGEPARRSSESDISMRLSESSKLPEGNAGGAVNRESSGLSLREISHEMSSSQASSNENFISELLSHPWVPSPNGTTIARGGGGASSSSQQTHRDNNPSMREYAIDSEEESGSTIPPPGSPVRPGLKPSSSSPSKSIAAAAALARDGTAFAEVDVKAALSRRTKSDVGASFSNRHKAAGGENKRPTGVLGAMRKGLGRIANGMSRMSKRLPSPKRQASPRRGSAATAR